MIHISEAEIREHVPFTAVIEAVAGSFATLDAGGSDVFETVRARGAQPDHFFAIKSARDGSSGLLGLKAGSYCPARRNAGKDPHTSTTLLLDAHSGDPLALVEANHLNGMRTAAADALAVRHLARPDADTLAVIGCGAQALYEIEAISLVHPLRRVLAAGRSQERTLGFAETLRARLDLEVECSDAEEAVRAAGIVVTATPATRPVLRAGWVRPGTHVSAMGADDAGKQELEVELLAAADLYVDWPAQAVIIGESQHAFRQGLIRLEDLECRTLGSLVRGGAPGRRDAQAITIFDSSGLATQDIAAAWCALRCVAERTGRFDIPLRETVL
ncbi:MAG TPA: ornithine cyclodeaminase family protein [Woeseiaceae bacterium]|nr:ornithine cyclodeaminase family protein [Woeseiaceae bacterium]